VEAVRKYSIACATDEIIAVKEWNEYFCSASDRIPRSTKMNEEVIRDPHQALLSILHCSLFVGFHPDQATEPVVDLAIYLRKPFAVVPCCVFPSDRRLSQNIADGDRSPEEIRVRTYDNFVCYLKRKHKKMRVAELPFDELGGSAARRTVLYMIPEDYI